MLTVRWLPFILLLFFFSFQFFFTSAIPYVTDCVMGELEKAGRRFKIALKVIKDARFQRLKCDHKGTYADDCLVQRVTQVSICMDTSPKWFHL